MFALPEPADIWAKLNIIGTCCRRETQFENWMRFPCISDQNNRAAWSEAIVLDPVSRETYNACPIMKLMLVDSLRRSRWLTEGMKHVENGLLGGNIGYEGSGI